MKKWIILISILVTGSILTRVFLLYDMFFGVEDITSVRQRLNGSFWNLSNILHAVASLGAIFSLMIYYHNIKSNFFKNNNLLVYFIFYVVIEVVLCLISLLLENASIHYKFG